MILNLIRTAIDYVVMIYAVLLNFIYVLYVVLVLSKRNKITNYKSAKRRSDNERRQNGV